MYGSPTFFVEIPELVEAIKWHAKNRKGALGCPGRHTGRRYRPDQSEDKGEFLSHLSEEDIERENTLSIQALPKRGILC